MGQTKETWYQIAIKGSLDPDWSNWLNGFQILNKTQPDGTCLTLLTGEFVDQAALRGAMNKIWDLNLELVSIFQIVS